MHSVNGEEMLHRACGWMLKVGWEAGVVMDGV